MSNTRDINIIMDLVAADGSKEDLNKQRNILIEKTNDALQLFDYAIDNGFPIRSGYDSVPGFYTVILQYFRGDLS